MRIVILLLMFFLYTYSISAQKQNQLTVFVKNDVGDPIDMVTISIPELDVTSFTNNEGKVVVNIPYDKGVTFIASIIGYVSEVRVIKLIEDTTLELIMKQDDIVLNEFTILGNTQKQSQMKSSLNVTSVDRIFIEENFSGSLMQSLEKIPGVQAMNIGSGQSKPAIRGLGFNRMVITENGIKHEGQQWGEDHGLEIDQFSFDNIDIIKGPGSLLYGSDAIGGVIDLKSNYIPIKKIEGQINLFGRSNNASIGTSVRIQGRKTKFFYKVGITLIDYADYKVPTDNIEYYSYVIKLKNKRLRNTAGKEQNAGITLGYISESFNSKFYVSNVNAKSGFFADAHGLEVRLSDIDYDKSSRDIDLPFHSVNHFKFINNSTWQLGEYKLDGNFSYQNNRRKEHSEPVSHGYMPIPPNNLERKFEKHTFAANLGLSYLLAQKHNIHIGANIEYQKNERGGWGFIIPDFRTTSSGIYIYDRFHVSDNLILSGGMRYDHSQTNIDSYLDWYKTPNEVGETVFKERASNLTRNFNSFTWSTGINYNVGEWNLKANIGKSFRAPIPKELGSDGVNYHIFRYEKGEAGLSPEESYQFDVGINWHFGPLDIQIDPFFNYFSNYIYLNPTSGYYEGLQMYYYTQSRVLRYGTEVSLTYNITQNIEMGIVGEYLYAKQLSGDKKGYTLPFSPPWSSRISIKYSPMSKWSGQDGYISLDYKFVGTQNEIVPPEQKTKGYQTFNMSVGRNFAFANKELKASLQGQNILNKKYYDHTSYYRLIDVPEAGRNFALMVALMF